MTAVTTGHDGATVVVTMDDGKANALTFDMFDGLNLALDEAEAAGAAVALVGRAGRFSAGFDLTTLSSGTPDAARLLRTGFELALRVVRFPRPVVAGCTGHAFAMGTFLLLAADYRIGAADPTHKVTANEVAIGITMPHAAALLCRRLSPAHYDRAVVQAEVFTPEAAVVAGFLDETVPSGDVVGAAVSKAQQLAALPPDAFAATKQRAHDALGQSLDGVIERDEREFLTRMGLA